MRQICSAPWNRRPRPGATSAGTYRSWSRPPSPPWWREAYGPVACWVATSRHRSPEGPSRSSACCPARRATLIRPLGACQAGRHRWPLPPGAADHAQFGAALRLPRQQHREAAGRVGAVGAAVAGRRTRQPRRPAHPQTTPPPSAARLHARGRAADQLPHRPRLPGRREDLGRRHRRAQRVRRRLQRRVHQLSGISAPP